MQNNERVITIQTPLMTQERFGELSGLRKEQIRGQINRGHLPVKRVGRLVLINMQKLAEQCDDQDQARD